MSGPAPAPGPSGREVAVTFDDLPVISVVHGDVESHRRITDQLLAALAEHGIPTTGFVNACNVEPAGVVEPARVDLLRRWLDAGHELANHTFSHLDLHAVPAIAYEADIVRGEPLVHELMGAHGRDPRWFRHPYLHTGTDLGTKRRVERFLADRGSRLAPVTVYTEDYLFAAALDRSRERGNARAAAEVAAAFAPYVERQLEYCERLAQLLLGREFPQVLLLHANSINAERIGEVAAMLRRRGYTFVTLEQALADPAYAAADDYVGAEGIGWLQRWALGRGLGEEFLDGEPATPRFVRVRAELGPLDRLRRSLQRRARAMLKSAKAALRATGVLPRRRRPAA
jgi:peptidoglycan/xylan/chitin deacetylase (PgdA/CDA1 family)